jgi:hypothetical protein
MLASAVAAAKNMIVRCARALWRTVKCVMEPARSATTAAAGAVRDSARSRSDLIAALVHGSWSSAGSWRIAPSGSPEREVLPIQANAAQVQDRLQNQQLAHV